MNLCATAAKQLIGGAVPLATQLVLDLPGMRIALHSNSARLLETLAHYFRHTLGNAPADVSVYAFEDTFDDARARVNMDFVDWSREPGKSGRKDAYADLDDGRLLLKVRTGMFFVQSEHQRVAVGPCEQNPNQIVNFINSQYMNHLQRNGALLCHAAAIAVAGHGVGLAGFSGGGKSTLMLRLLGHEDTSYVSNDRVMLVEQGHTLLANGIPKLPRVNPGTIVNDAVLLPMLSRSEADSYRAMTRQQLWDLERKYDVDVLTLYGDGKIAAQAPLSMFVILNWQHETARPFRLEQVDLRERPDLLRAVMKSPGPFYQDAQGLMWTDHQTLDSHAYLERLCKVPVYEASGAVDFTQAASACRQAVNKLERSDD